MSDLLDQAIALLRELPSSAQDEAAQLLFDWIGDRSPAVEVDDRSAELIDPDDLAAVEEGLADARAGRIATEAEVATAFTWCAIATDTTQ